MRVRGRIKGPTTWALLAGSFLLMAYNTYSYRRAANPSVSRPEVPDHAMLAGLRFKRTNGGEFVIPSSGRYLISFLTVECGPCQRQVEYLNRVTREGEYSAVLGVFSDSLRRVADFESAFDPQFTSLIRTSLSSDPMLELSTFPQTVEISNGVVVKRWLGVQESFP